MCVVLQIPAESGKSANDIEDPEHYRWVLHCVYTVTITTGLWTAITLVPLVQSH